MAWKTFRVLKTSLTDWLDVGKKGVRVIPRFWYLRVRGMRSWEMGRKKTEAGEG